MERTESTPTKPKLKRLHTYRCGVSRMEYDGYDDVREACERKLAQWEREGVLSPAWRTRSHDWIFGKSTQEA